MASNSTECVRDHELNVRMTLVCQEQARDCTADIDFTERSWHPKISYFPDGQQIISASCEKSARLWDLREGKEIKEAQVVCEQEVHIVEVSRDGRWIVTVAGNVGPWEIKAREVKTGVVKTFQGHSGSIFGIDISLDSKLLASRCSTDSTTWVWSLDNGRLVAGPFASHDNGQDTNTIRFSQDSKKLAVKAFELEVWDIEEQKLDVRLLSFPNPGRGYSLVPGVPIFWTMGDKTLVAVFNIPGSSEFNTIYEFDSLTLKTVRTPFKGHTGNISGFALSYDCVLLVSASSDAVKLWAFESRQLLASFNLGLVLTLILSPDARQIASIGRDYYDSRLTKIKIYDIPPDILAKLPPSQEPSTISHKTPHLHDALNSVATAHRAIVRRNSVSASFVTRPSRCSPNVQQEQLSTLRHLRKLLSFSFHRNAKPILHGTDHRDPLDYPATITTHGIPGQASPTKDTAVALSDHSESSRPTQARYIPESSGFASTPNRSRLSNWWHINTAIPVVSVPFTQGKKRNAIAGAPKPRDDCRPDEEFDSPSSSPNSDSQCTSASAQAMSGEHGSGRLCFCL